MFSFKVMMIEYESQKCMIDLKLNLRKESPFIYLIVKLRGIEGSNARSRRYFLIWITVFSEVRDASHRQISNV